MKCRPAEVGNGPVEKEDTDMEEEEGGGGGEEEDEEEEGDVEEFLKLDAELDALSSALDTLEQRNDSINGRLRRILEENRALGEIVPGEPKKTE